jgi:single-strand DNA-binding protein
MNITIEGKIIVLGNLEYVWQNQLPKRTFVVEEVADKEWKSGMVIDVTKDKTSLLDDYAVWDIVKVYVNTRANQYNQRWYTSLSAWKIEKLSWGTSSHSAPKTQTQYNEVDDELPF